MGRGWFLLASFVVIGCGFATAQQPSAPLSSDAPCIECHSKTNPAVVSEWKGSKHSEQKVGCISCHGGEHSSGDNAAKVKIPNAETCAQCHQTQVEQYRRGKHRNALAAMRTVPMVHWHGMLVVGDQEGCVSCHRVGSPAKQNELRQGEYGGTETGANAFGGGACDSCHSRHSFSAAEARQPQACQKCHSGPDHDQWGMYASSLHGLRYKLKQQRFPPGESATPTCQTCHMPSGDHEVRTAWGYFGLSLPLPDDPQWAADRSDILKALAAFGPDGRETTILTSLKANEALRANAADWQRERDKMIKVCAQCHSEAYAKRQLQRDDEMIRNADHLLAEAIREVAGLYRDGVLPRPWGRADYPFPWLISFRHPASAIEYRLQTMYLEHRTQAFQGAFHDSPNYAIRRGWSELQRDLTEIQEMAAVLRRWPPAAKPSRKPGKVPGK